MYDLFPEEDHGALCQVFEASQFDLERSVEAMLQVLNERAGAIAWFSLCLRIELFSLPFFRGCHRVTEWHLFI